MELIKKLEILADAAKYDASCASSGAGRKSAPKGSSGFGSTEGMGICHSYTPDGRCISLLKILLTNFCLFECSYCVNRNSSNVARARFSVAEVVQLTTDFYKRNYIEGLFLSSGIIRSPDYTMEQLVEVARRLREEEGFHGYIHLKTIPEADERLIRLAGLYADRLSINIEMPMQSSLDRFAPEKSHKVIQSGMQQVAEARAEFRSRPQRRRVRRKPRRFVPAGQSTQMIIGADDSTDRHILTSASGLYRQFDLKRVYYSAFSPIPDASSALPPQAPPLQRENRLYQADWLLRFYQFKADELLPDHSPSLDLEIDPKLAWALKHREFFPVDINRASRYWLLRVPGLGPGSVEKILQGRRARSIRLEDLKRLNLRLEKIGPFVECKGHHPGRSLNRESLRESLLARPQHQLSLFG